MPYVAAADGIKLYYEEIGTGTPVVFVHGYAGDDRTWEPQVRHFGAHRCVTFSQRGYPPSDVPSDPARYGQDIARDDVISLMDALAIERAHVVGHSMGAYTALHVGIRYPRRCISVTTAGCGWDSHPEAEQRNAMSTAVCTLSRVRDTPSPARSRRCSTQPLQNCSLAQKPAGGCRIGHHNEDEPE